MKKLKLFIVEDQEFPLNRLLRLVNEYPNVFDTSTITIARSFEEAQIIILNRNKFDVSILDKYLERGKIGLELITKENKDYFGTIVLKSQDETSERHFEEIRHLGGYLVLRKPYNDKDFAEFVKELSAIKFSLKAEPSSNRSILINDIKGVFPIQHDDIVYIEIKDNTGYIFYRTFAGLIEMLVTTGKQLNEFEKELNSITFFRTCRSHLINLNFLDFISKEDITLKGVYNKKEIKVPLAENKRKALLARFDK